MPDCAVILAGGQGTRLRSVVSDRPKAMALVNGRPFVTYLLDQLVNAGLKRVVLCTGYLAECIQQELGDTFKGAELIYSRELQPLGTAGALRQAIELALCNRLLVMNGDSWCACSLAEFEYHTVASGFLNGMVLAEVTDVSRFGAVEVDPSGRLTRFVEKGAATGRGLINAGIYLLQAEVIRQLAPGMMISLESDVMPYLLKQGIQGYCTQGAFIDIGVPEEFKRAQAMFGAGDEGIVTA